MSAHQAPSVSLIVLNWNAKDQLDACLESVLALDYPEERLEVILCDNGSTDGSPEYVRARFPRVRVVALERNLGFAEGNDRAVEHATGEWIGFLNNDMWVEPSWLADMVGSLHEHPRAVCVASRIKNWDGSALDFIGGGMNYQGHGFQVDHGEIESSLDVDRRVLFACGGAMLIRRDVFTELGGFDPDYFAFFEDVDLGWRLNLLGHEIWYTSRATAYHRHHGTADKVADHKLHMLYERNALFTIYKCYESEHLNRVLPTALLLVNERGISIAAPDRQRFRITPPEPSSPEATGPEPLAERARRVMREEGLLSAVAKTASLSRYYVRRVLGWVLLEVGQRLHADLIVPSDRIVVWPSVAASQYLAISEFAHSLDRLHAQRCWIQQRRRVSDEELLPLFVDPFFANYTEPRYLSFYGWLTRVQGLDELFPRRRD